MNYALSIINNDEKAKLTSWQMYRQAVYLQENNLKLKSNYSHIVCNSEKNVTKLYPALLKGIY